MDKMSSDNPYLLGYTLMRGNQVIGLHRYPLLVVPEVVSQSEMYPVKQGDTLTRIAYKKYNNPKEWWVIADYNNITVPWDLSGVSTLIIPPLDLAKKFIKKD